VFVVLASSLKCSVLDLMLHYHPCLENQVVSESATQLSELSQMHARQRRTYDKSRTTDDKGISCMEDFQYCIILSFYPWLITSVMSSAAKRKREYHG